MDLCTIKDAYALICDMLDPLDFDEPDADRIWLVRGALYDLIKAQDPVWGGVATGSKFEHLMAQTEAREDR